MGTKQKGLLTVAVIIAIIFAIPFFYVKATYNHLIQLDEEVKAAWAQVENQLQRRYDLIPNYVEVVKGYAAHEKDVLVRVTEARAKVARASSISDKIRANNELSSALSRLMLVVERYPELKANANFIRLQDELAGTENRIAVERRRFNESVRRYNTEIRSFPTNIIAGFFGFHEKDFFKVPKEKQAVPKIKF